MANVPITDLPELSARPSTDDYFVIVDSSEALDVAKNKKVQFQYMSPTFLTTRLTSTSWDGDAFSTTGKTLIDLSAVFSAPAGIKAAIFGTSIRDSGSAASTTGCYLILGPTDTNLLGVYTYCAGLTNDAFTHQNMIVPCNSNGDVYYQVNASGLGTMDIFLEIWGYWL